MVKGQLGNISFQFNPENFEWTREIEYVESPIMGMEVAPLEYTGGTGVNASLELVFDGVDTADKVREFQKYAAKGRGNAPPVLLFQYANLMIDCVITSLRVVNRLLDKRSNKLIRATVALALKQYVTEEYHRTSREEKGERIYEVASARFPVAGETFRNIAWREYGSPDLAKAISDYNPEIMLQCNGPIIPAGLIIRIPPWSFAKQYLEVKQQIGLVEFN